MESIVENNVAAHTIIYGFCTRLEWSFDRKLAGRAGRCFVCDQIKVGLHKAAASSPIHTYKRQVCGSCRKIVESHIKWISKTYPLNGPMRVIKRFMMITHKDDVLRPGIFGTCEICGVYQRVHSTTHSWREKPLFMQNYYCEDCVIKCAASVQRAYLALCVKRAMSLIFFDLYSDVRWLICAIVCKLTAQDMENRQFVALLPEVYGGL